MSERDAEVVVLRGQRRFLGIYCEHPEEIVAHVAQLTLSLAASLDRKVLFTIACNPVMLRRAGNLVMQYVVRETREDITRDEFLRLLSAVSSIVTAS